MDPLFPPGEFRASLCACGRFRNRTKARLIPLDAVGAQSELRRAMARTDQRFADHDGRRAHTSTDVFPRGDVPLGCFANQTWR
jgi:hypothetical protein